MAIRLLATENTAKSIQKTRMILCSIFIHTALNSDLKKIQVSFPISTEKQFAANLVRS
jgi:hypothetical protein